MFFSQFNKLLKGTGVRNVHNIQYSVLFLVAISLIHITVLLTCWQEQNCEGMVPLVLGSVNVDVGVVVVIKKKWAWLVHGLDPLLHLRGLLNHPQGLWRNLCAVTNTLKKKSMCFGSGRTPTDRSVTVAMAAMMSDLAQIYHQKFGVIFETMVPCFQTEVDTAGFSFRQSLLSDEMRKQSRGDFTSCS